MSYQRYIEINKSFLKNNILSLRNKIRNAPIIAMVKGNCYGLGIETMLPLLIENELTTFGVTGIYEALEAKRVCPSSSVINFESATAEEIDVLVRNETILSIMSFQDFKIIEKYIRRTPHKMQVIIKVNTGLNRWGCTMSETIKIAKEINRLNNVYLLGLVTTLTEKFKADLISIQQVQRLKNELSSLGYDNLFISFASSQAICNLNINNYETVRTGISMFGIYPDDEARKLRTIELTPVFELKSRIALIRMVKRGDYLLYKETFRTPKNSRIAVIPLGYTHGYSSLLKGAQVLIAGKRYPIIGISMSTILVDVSSSTQCRPGDAVTLIGKQGNEEITLEELGNLSGQSPYSLISMLSDQLPRVVLD